MVFFFNESRIPKITIYIESTPQNPMLIIVRIRIKHYKYPTPETVLTDGEEMNFHEPRLS